MLIAQITDTHIVAKGEHWLSEPLTKTSERLEKVVSYLNQLIPVPDVVLLTGDASDTGTKAAYCHFKELIEPLKIPLYVIPGNHDCREEMRNAFSKKSYMPDKGFINYVIDDYPVCLIGLDTLVQGKDYGSICEERFIWLNQVMELKKEKPKLIFMHHPPAKIGHKIFDSINCVVPHDFEKLISTQKHLLGIITGHYHHLCVTSYGNKSCFIAPSISPVHYFTHPQDDDVTALELQDPAITLHKWHGGEVITSHVLHLKEQYFRIDWSSIKSKKIIEDESDS